MNITVMLNSARPCELLSLRVVLGILYHPNLVCLKFLLFLVATVSRILGHIASFLYLGFLIRKEGKIIPNAATL